MLVSQIEKRPCSSPTFSLPLLAAPLTPEIIFLQHPLYVPHWRMEQHPQSSADAAAANAAASSEAEPHHPPAATEDGAPPEAYHPADYRWVPVRRVPRYDGWTDEKMRRFIEALADTGQVSLAAKAVGMSRESAYRLRRSAHAAAFARAWDAARHHAGSFLEDVAFERAIEGIEQNVYNEYGEVICTKRVPNDRLLMFLLRHLKPECYAKEALASPAPPPEPFEASLRALEPPLPAPPEQLLSSEQMADELELADIADGTLPHFLFEQRPVKTREQRELTAAAKQQRGEKLSKEEFADYCRYLDPTLRPERPRKRYR